MKKDLKDDIYKHTKGIFSSFTAFEIKIQDKVDANERSNLLMPTYQVQSNLKFKCNLSVI